MKVFDFQPSDYAGEYAKNGYVHIVGGVCPEFLRHTQDLVEELLSNPQQVALHEFEIKGKKRQFLFEFPQHSIAGVYDAMAGVSGLNRNTLTLCERHIKVYDHTANPHPPPHKDRVASTLTVGLPLNVGVDSYLELYPSDQLEINPYNSSALWRSSLDPEQLPEVVLQDIQPVRLEVQPGDTVMFRGSSIYHERINAANTRILYLKFNDLRLDPTGEDPMTQEQLAASREQLDALPDETLFQAVVEVSPRLVRISRHYTRLHWKEVLQCYVAGESEFGLSQEDFRLLQQADGRRTVRGLLDTLGVPHPQHAEVLPRVRRLINRQALVFIRDANRER